MAGITSLNTIKGKVLVEPLKYVRKQIHSRKHQLKINMSRTQQENTDRTIQGMNY